MFDDLHHDSLSLQVKLQPVRCLFLTLFGAFGDFLKGVEQDAMIVMAYFYNFTFTFQNPLLRPQI